MDTKVTYIFLLCSVFFQSLNAQRGKITGTVSINGQLVELAQITLDATNFGTFTNKQGYFALKKIPSGNYQMSASYIGYSTISKNVTIDENQTDIHLSFNLTEQTMQLDDIVVTGTKTIKRKTNSPVIVNVINSQTLGNLQVCNLSEGLKFQPGLRVETDCQTCNYTQLRINGLAGGYSQILINGRPIFSPLTGLYGLEQIPTNMIDRIEVLRGGGSSLYGSSAIGGTVNVITKIPRNNSFELNYTYQNIDGQTSDNILSGNATLVSKNKNSGISFFFNRRQRGFYDANNDNFSEIPLIESTAIGSNLFFLPKENHKLEINLSYINEYRFGGEMIEEIPAYMAQQAEERTHNVWMASADYQINFNNDNSSLISYIAWQNTDRDHYTGIIPAKETPEFNQFINNPPYGLSDVSTVNLGVQLNHRLNAFLGGTNVFTLGTEYLYDDVLDKILAYQYLIDQTTRNFSVFLQSDWKINSQLTVLSGIRMDKHSLVENLVINPRASLLYKYKDHTQFRVNYGTGFRAPQAFDTDLHIAFSGGGVSRISLSPELKPEKSHSISASINYDKPMERWIAGFTIEGFYNRLNEVFFLQPVGQDSFGELFEKQNGNGATVRGITLELRANFERKIQLESGFTLQSSKFDTPIEHIDGLPKIREFARTPNDYGYAILTFTPNKKWNATLNYVYTGGMKIPHFAGAPNQTTDEIINSKRFSELSTKIGYTLPLETLGSDMEIYAGVKNLFDAYQDDFDIEKNRDSNFIYGPALPRTFYIGLKLKI